MARQHPCIPLGEAASHTIDPGVLRHTEAYLLEIARDWLRRMQVEKSSVTCSTIYFYPREGWTILHEIIVESSDETGSASGNVEGVKLSQSDCCVPPTRRARSLPPDNPSTSSTCFSTNGRVYLSGRRLSARSFCLLINCSIPR